MAGVIAGAPVPRRTCQACDEFLPHACAPVVLITREKRTARVVTIRDREPVQQSPEHELEAETG